jgi:hypothetical protein
MSFLSGIVNLGKSAVKFLSGNSVWSSLAKTAILGLAVNKLSSAANKGNNTDTKNIDQGVRLQATPDAAAKIPVLYGSAFFGGNISDAAMTNSNKTMWYCLVLAEKTGNLYSNSAASAYTLNNVYWNNQRMVFNSDGVTVNYTVDSTGVIDRSLSGLARVYFYAGGRTAGQVPSGYSGSVPNAETLFPNWTSGTHAMTDLIFALVRVDYNREKNVTGIGDMLFNVTNTMKYPGDAVYDYLTNTRYGAGIAAGNILTTDITALNTYSFDNIAYDDQGTGAETLADRYQINGLIDTANPVLENAEKILSSAASWLSYDTHQGKWGIVINKAETSVASFNDSNILGNISLSGTGLQDLYNEVKVEFPHRELRDSADFYNITIPESSIPADWADFSRNANEEDNVLNLVYDIVNEPIQAQMLGLIELKQSRLDKVIQFETDFSYYNLKAGDVIDVTNTRFSFTNKLFRIVTITEKQDGDGPLSMEITALEYNVNVYSVADLFRFTRSDNNGIITIGSIGQPGTPTVSKIEQDARPRLEITSTAPTGVVEGMEYWLTTDVAIADDANRSYTLIGVRRPVGGGVFTSGTNVTLEYVSSAADFFIKTRGFNATTVGQFSNVSGLVEFAPVQVTNAIDVNTSAFDSTGGLLGAIALIDLLGKVADLFPEGEGGKSLFEKIFDVFEDETGVDLVGQASGGELVVASNLTTKADGTNLSTDTNSLDFIGPIEASGSSDIEVKLTDGSANKDILAWNAEAGEWQLISGCISCDFPEIPPVIPAVPCSLDIESTLPTNNYSLGTTCHADSDVPYTGSYFIEFSINPGTAEGGDPNPAIPFVNPLQPGSGSVYLYGTDGTLEQQLSESQVVIWNNVVELPFATRQPGKDYYILMDEGFVTYCDCENVEINAPTTWTFRTSLDPEPPYLPMETLDLESTSGAPNYSRTKVNFSPAPVGTVCSSQNIVLTFGQRMKKGTGSILVRDRDTGVTAASLSVSAATLSPNGRTVTFGAVTGLTPDTFYDAIAPEGLLVTDYPASSLEVCDKVTNIPAGPQVKSVAGTWGFKSVADLAVTSFNYCPEASGNSAVTSSIQIIFNKSFAVNDPGPAPIQIFSADGSLHQEIDLRGTFEDDKYGNIYGYNNNVLTINPTKPFKAATDYYINIPSGTLLDGQCNLAWSGITDTNTIAWRTDGIEVEAPDLPTYGSLYIDLKFDRPVKRGQGKLRVVTTSGELVTIVSSNDWTVQLSDQPFT